MLKKLSLLLSCLLLISTSLAWSGSYQYLAPAEVRQKLAAGAPLLLLDIQVAEEFAAHHIDGAMASYAYPVKSDADRQKLAALLDEVAATDAPVAIVCPAGRGGAKRTYDYLQSQGIASQRLFILEKGQQGWPYPELLAQQ